METVSFLQIHIHFIKKQDRFPVASYLKGTGKLRLKLLHQYTQVSRRDLQ